jgi:hypothetical protein
MGFVILIIPVICLKFGLGYDSANTEIAGHTCHFMNTNPLNLTVRFLLEIAMLIIFGYWGWLLNGDWERWSGAIGLPLIAAALWGIFRIPDDPKSAPVEVQGIVRLLLEWILFGLAI